MAGQLWAVNALGGYMYTDELTNVLRTALQPIVRFRQFCDAKDATDKGLGKGNLFHWNVYSDVATAGGELNEQEAMPETNYSITQGQLTITEYGNSVPYTGKLDDLSKQPVKEIIHKVLKNDAKKVLDTAAHAQFDATGGSVVGENGTTITTKYDGAVAANNNSALLNVHVKLIVDEMKERNIPPYADDDYYCVAWPSTYRSFKNNLEDIHKYIETGFSKIMNGEIGRYEGTRFIEQTHIAKEATSFATNSASDWAFFFGEDTVAEALAIPEEIRGKIPGDFGRSRGIAWYYLGGFGIIHSGYSNDETRILKWTSAG